MITADNLSVNETVRDNYIKLVEVLTCFSEEKFNMNSFLKVRNEYDHEFDEVQIEHNLTLADFYECNSTCCAIGLANFYEIGLTNYATYVGYAVDNFSARDGIEGELTRDYSKRYNSFFSPKWSKYDDTPTQCALRIRRWLYLGEFTSIGDELNEQYEVIG